MQLFSEITIPNAICFAPDGHTAYFTDTPLRQILAVDLDAEGWPCSAPRVAVDLTATAENPDGAVVDAQGNIWNAQWGAARLACYSPQGTLIGDAGNLARCRPHAPPLPEPVAEFFAPAQQKASRQKP